MKKYTTENPTGKHIAMKRVLSLLFVLIVSSQVLKAQQGFGTSNPASSSVIDMTATNKGALLPRVALTSTIVAAPVNSPANALTVFNTATTGDVTPGYYYWSIPQLKWIRLSDATNTGAYWSLTGNAGTSSATNFLGTTDNQDLIFKVNNGLRFLAPKSTDSYVLTGAPAMLNSYLSNPLSGLYYGGFTTFNAAHSIYSFATGTESYGWDGGAATGTPDAPGIPNANALMSTVNGMLYDGTSFVKVARMRMFADGTPSATSLPTKINFWTTPVGAKAAVERLTIKNDGGIGIGVSAPNTSSILDVTSTTRGALLPRVALTSTIVAAPVTAPANSLTVFNTATTGDVTPGYYYWSVPQLKWVRLLDANTPVEPWRIQTTTNSATANSDKIYQSNKVAVGNFSGAESTKMFEVKGDLKSEYQTIGTNNVTGVEVNHPLLAPGGIGEGTLTYWGNPVGKAHFVAVDGGSARAVAMDNISAPTKISNFIVDLDAVNVYSKHNGQAKQATLEVNGNDGRFALYANRYDQNWGSMVKSNGTDGLFLYHAGSSSATAIVDNNDRTEIVIKKTEGVTFNHHNTGGGLVGSYTFPKTNGTVGQVMTKSATNDIVWAAPVATPKFFYAPSMVLPTTAAGVLPAGVTYAAGVFTVDLYAIYSAQFGMTGATGPSASRTAIKSTTATTLPVIANSGLEYFVTYFDNSVFNPSTMTLSDAGILTYEIIATGVVTEKTYMNIVFKVK